MAHIDGAIPAPIALPALPTIPFKSIAPFMLLGLILSFLLIYFVGAEQGATSFIGGEMVHEWVHDARHLLGFPCH